MRFRPINLDFYSMLEPDFCLFILLQFLVTASQVEDAWGVRGVQFISLEVAMEGRFIGGVLLVTLLPLVQNDTFMVPEV